MMDEDKSSSEKAEVKSEPHANISEKEEGDTINKSNSNSISNNEKMTSESISEHIVSEIVTASESHRSLDKQECSQSSKLVLGSDSWPISSSLNDNNISKESPLNLPSEQSERKQNNDMAVKDDCSNKSSSSEEIIKLDIRGHAAPKFQSLENIIFMPMPFNVPEPSDYTKKNELKPDKDGDSVCDESDRLVEELLIDDARPKDDVPKQADVEFTPCSTMSTDYKTVCEEYYAKIQTYKKNLLDKEAMIQELNATLQKVQDNYKNLYEQNSMLTTLIEKWQLEHSDTDILKDNLSDFIRHESTLRPDESTKFFSAIMSSGKNSECCSSATSDKDFEGDEIIIDHSRCSPDEIVQDDLTKIIKSVPFKLHGDLVLSLKKDIEDYSKYQIDEAVKESQGKLNAEHLKEMEDLRQYYERKCSEMEKSYTEDVENSASNDAPDSLDIKATLALSSPIRVLADKAVNSAHQINEQDIARLQENHESEMDLLHTEHIEHINSLTSRHREELTLLREQLSELKAQLQTRQNTSVLPIYEEDVDLVLEKGVQANLMDDHLHAVKQELAIELQEQIQALMSDPDAEVSSWPPELVILKDKINSDSRQNIESMKKHYEDELSSLRAELADRGGGGDNAAATDKWKQRRNHTFDKNRHLEEVTKERDGLKKMTCSLQHIVAYLIQYFNDCEDELNKTVLADISLAANALDVSFSIEQCTPNSSLMVTNTAKRVHFAPDISAIIPALNDERLEEYLQEQRDLSLDVRKELEMSLMRLRNEANELLEMSSKVTAARKSIGPPAGCEDDEAKIGHDSRMQEKLSHCHNCLLRQKEMEEYISEGFQREMSLRNELATTKLKLSQLTMDDLQSDVIVAEGLGTLMSTPSRGTVVSGNRFVSLDSPRTVNARQYQEIETLVRERDDLVKQLEAANRQLRTTRAFVEEQTHERESEREEFQGSINDLRKHNAHFAQKNAAQKDEIDQLESQLKEMSAAIDELNSKRTDVSAELKTSQEKINLLQEIITNLEGQLEQKVNRESEILKQVEELRRTIDERDAKMRSLVDELESIRLERTQQEMTRITSPEVTLNEDEERKLFKEQVESVSSYIQRRAALLERMLADVNNVDVASQSEDVSPPLQKEAAPECDTERMLIGNWGPMQSVCDALQHYARVQDVFTRTLYDTRRNMQMLHDAAQEVRAERDVLQARMCQQALRLSELDAKLQTQRESAEALRTQATANLAVKLHDAAAERERLESQLERANRALNRVAQPGEPTDKIINLERELAASYNQITRLEKLVDDTNTRLNELQKEIKQKDIIIRDMLSLKLKEDDASPLRNRESNDYNETTKNSARTLSDIISLSEFDDQDIQMRRADIHVQENSIEAGAPYINDDFNKTLPPNLHFSLNISRPEKSPLDHLDLASFKTPLTKDKSSIVKFNSTGKTFLDTPLILENCSLFPNRNAEDIDKSVEPKKIDFSMEQTHIEQQLLDIFSELNIREIDNKDVPNSIQKLKEEILTLREDLTRNREFVTSAGELPVVKAEVENLRVTLQSTLENIQKDKVFYDNKLKTHIESENYMKQQLSEKDADLKLIKEDLVRRENTIIELAREKRNLQAKIEELETECETLKKLEHLVSEKNLQIDGLNEHLDKLDDLQQRLNYKMEEVDQLNQRIVKLTSERDAALSSKTDLNVKLEKIEKELENSNMKLKDSMNETEKISASLSKSVDEIKRLTAEIHDKECQMQIMNEDTEAFHEELASLRRQLAGGTPSPSHSGEDSPRSVRVPRDKKELARIRKQVTYLQAELTFNKKELNEKVFELERLKLEVTELRNDSGRAQRQNNHLEELVKLKDTQLEDKTRESQVVYQQYNHQLATLQNENDELRQQIVTQEEAIRTPPPTTPERCVSPSLQLERSLRRELASARRLDSSLAALLSPPRIPPLPLHTASTASEDTNEMSLVRRDFTPKPNELSQLIAENERLAVENDRLTGECERNMAELDRLVSDRDRIVLEKDRALEQVDREKAMVHSLQLSVDALRDKMDATQLQDRNMIQILKRRLESILQTENSVREELDRERCKVNGLQEQLDTYRQHTDNATKIQLQIQLREKERLESENTILRGKVDALQTRLSEVQTELFDTQTNARHSVADAKSKIAHLMATIAEQQAVHTVNKETQRTPMKDACSASSPLTLDREPLASRLNKMEQENLSMNSPNSTSTQQVMRYLHSRCLRLESCRKALVWQKRFLQKSLEGYTELEKKLNLPLSINSITQSTGAKRFKCVAMCVVAFIRMGIIVRRRRGVRTLSRNTLFTPTPIHNGSDYSRDKSNKYETLPRASSIHKQHIHSITPNTFSSTSINRVETDTISQSSNRLSRVTRRLHDLLH